MSLIKVPGPKVLGIDQPVGTRHLDDSESIPPNYYFPQGLGQVAIAVDFPWPSDINGGNYYGSCPW